jgi:hypothetical protein
MQRGNKKAEESRRQKKIASRIGSHSRKPTRCGKWWGYLKYVLLVGVVVAAVVVPIVLRRQNAEKEYLEGLKQSQKGNFATAAQVGRNQHASRITAHNHSLHFCSTFKTPLIQAMQSMVHS